VLVMLVDSGAPRDDDDRGSSREPWLVTMLEYVLPWPALIVWLCVASRVTGGWVSVGFIFAAIGLAAWRGLCALPADGLNQSRQ
jgi:hypothetical protein